MNWILRLLCPDSGKVAQLEKDLSAKNDKIKWYEEKIKWYEEQNEKGTPHDFTFDSLLVTTISGDKLRGILTDAFPDAQIMLNDGIFQYTALKEVQRWASFDPTNELKYRAEELDCDKFALTDMADFKKENNYQLGNAVFGICEGYAGTIGYHAWNIAYVEEGIIMLEPQTDQIWKREEKPDYKPDFIYI